MKTREELEAEFNATITLWSDSEERINAQLCRENNVVSDSLESAEMMLLCDVGEIVACPEGMDSSTVKTSNQNLTET